MDVFTCNDGGALLLDDVFFLLQVNDSSCEYLLISDCDTK